MIAVRRSDGSTSRRNRPGARARSTAVRAAPRRVSTPDIVAPLAPIVEIFERLSIPYSVAGSVASSAHGVARATLDVDLVADLHAEHVDPLVAAISADYYVDRDAALDAIARRSMFNVVHLATMLKVDIYELTSRSFDQEPFRRRGPVRLDEPF